MSAIAAQTKRVKICFGATDPHRRHPSTMAHAAVTLDYISKGRLRLGIAPGEAMNLVPYGVEWKNPVSKLREAVIIMKKLWTEENVNFSGKFYSLKGAFLATKPLQKPHPPVYIGGHGPRAMEVAAELADGWYPFLLTRKKFEEGLMFIRGISKKFGRTPNSIEPLFELVGVIHKDHDRAVEGASFLTRAIGCLWPQVLDDLGLNEFHREELSLLKWTCSKKNLQKLVDSINEMPWEPDKWLGNAIAVAGRRMR